MIEYATTEQVKELVLSNYWTPTHDEIESVRRSFRMEDSIVLIGATLDQVQVAWRRSRAPHTCTVLQMINVVYGFKRPTDVDRAKSLTQRAARCARCYLYRWERYKTDEAFLAHLKPQERKFQFYTAWLRHAS